MKERPILFNAEMVQAILSGRKTQTRRVVKPQRNTPNWSVKPAENPQYERHTHDWWLPTGTKPYSALPSCPFGKVGDQLWVRETFALGADFGESDVGYFYRSTDPGWDDNDTGARWRPSLHMPRAASRINLLITGVRVERLDDISQHDARCEGIVDHHNVGQEKYLFSRLWRDIYGEESWSDNPWVWVIEFERVAPAGEQS